MGMEGFSPRRGQRGRQEETSSDIFAKERAGFKEFFVSKKRTKEWACVRGFFLAPLADCGMVIGTAR
jgi:hypothetical protein